MTQSCDVFVVGGGINGCGIARDAAGRGYTVSLAEMNDLASATSSWSTKLIHGGLRYLEHYEFRLVREALIEREILWGNAPHIIGPLRFVLPHHAGLRPAWLLRTGLFLYDHLGGRRKLPSTSTLDLETAIEGKPLKPEYRTGFEYSDCRVDDSRLVVLNAMDARTRGADIRTRTKVTAIRRSGDRWLVSETDTRTGAVRETEARVVVNAAGPWVDHAFDGMINPTNAKVRLVKGSHIVVPRHYEHDRAYIFQNADGRIVFAIPYEDDFTLIGTTDVDYHGDPAAPAISAEETDYLCKAASAYFRNPVTPESVVWSYSGVRPLYDDGASKAQEATRDYVLKTEGGNGVPGLVNIFGGKITTYRKLAESALGEIETLIGAKGPAWTASAPLPGGDFPTDGREALARSLVSTHPFLEPAQAKRLVKLYGTNARRILDGARSAADLGEAFEAGLTAREIAWLVKEEWAETSDDILWRRSKLGLRVSSAGRKRLDEHLATVRAGAARSAEAARC
ncbi:MAG: glycerol-3-phosphate dehydrogenase [Hyphomicrobiales bacterium]